MRRLRRTWTKPKCWHIRICGWTGLYYVARADFIGDRIPEKHYRARNYDDALRIVIALNKEKQSNNSQIR